MLNPWSMAPANTATTEADSGRTAFWILLPWRIITRAIA